MMSMLYSIQSDQMFWILIAVGVLVGICSIVFISILSSWAMKETLDRAIPLLIFAVIAGTSAYAIGNRVLHMPPQTRANAAMKVSGWAVNEQGLVTEVTFRTSMPVIAYLEYKTSSGETVPILSAASAQPGTEHRFSTDRPVSREGILSAVVDGITYPMPR